MNVLIDYHHADLAEALHRLFEDRLGMEVYIPSGLGWWEAGYWSFGRYTYGDNRLARQFLEMPAQDDFHPRQHRLLTYEQFREMDDWAVICASVPDNQDGYARLAREVGAEYVVQVGNTGQYVDWSLDPLVLNSSEMPIRGRGLQMHQEFDKDGAFAFSPYVGEGPAVASFMNLFHRTPGIVLWQEAEERLFHWRFDLYGHEQEFIKPTSAIAERMREYAFGWHDKPVGDGFGYVVHYWAAIGRPLIGHASYYRGKLAEDLWEDGVTCIDLDRWSIPQAVDMMRAIAADPTWYSLMCHAIRSRLDARIDYAAEAEAIREALKVPVPA